MTLYKCPSCKARALLKDHQQETEYCSREHFSKALPDSHTLYHLFFYLTKRYNSFHVDCDSSARTFSHWHDVAAFLSYCESYDYGRVMHNGLEFYRWGLWSELEAVA